MPIRTRLTERLGIRVPILNAPMGGHAGGRMAAALTEAGGLGLLACFGPVIDKSEFWIEEQFAAAGNTRIGAGFITWRLAAYPHLLDLALARAPAAMMLSFGDPAPFAPRIKQAGTLLICQVQTLAYARQALDAGADILVAQGGEAGGHGSVLRSTMTLVPEVADLLARESPDTLLVAAGGIADGRGLAAALMLGADGILMGSRLWASDESLAGPVSKQAVVEANGDSTVRTNVADMIGGRPWPREFTQRIIRNDFTARWHGREHELEPVVETVREDYREGIKARDLRRSEVNTTEAVGLIHSIAPIATIVDDVCTAAERLLSGSWQK